MAGMYDLTLKATEPKPEDPNVRFVEMNGSRIKMVRDEGKWINFDAGPALGAKPKPTVVAVQAKKSCGMGL